MTQQGDRGRREPTLVGREVAPQQRTHAEDLQEIVRDAHRAQALCLPGACERLPPAEIEEREIGGQRLEAPVLVPPRLECIAPRGARREPARAFILDPRQPIRSIERQWPEQHRIDDAEHGGGGADAKREGEQRHGREPGGLGQLAEGENDVRTHVPLTK